MCGIVGFLDLTHQSTERQLEYMVSTLNHISPDSKDHLLLKRNDYSIDLETLNYNL